MTHKLDWQGKTLEVSGSIFLDNEELFNEEGYDDILLVVDDADEYARKLISGRKLLVVKLSEIKKAKIINELGF